MSRNIFVKVHCGKIEPHKSRNDRDMRPFPKKIIFLLLLIVMPVRVMAQDDIYGRNDPNEEQEYMTDYQWNYWPHGFLVWGRFVKNYIGLPMNILKGEDVVYPLTITRIGSEDDTLLISKPPKDTDSGYVSVKGFKCTKFTDCHNVGLSLVSLDDVRKKFCPDVKGTVVYMINKFFIMTDEEYYKIDSDYILRVSVVSSKDIDALKDRKPFSIIRILTKTRHNCEVEGLNGYPMDDIRW